MPRRVPLRSNDEVRAVFRKYLRDHGVKYTRARAEILDAVLDLHEHFEAEQLLCSLREHGRNVAKATVYRTLHLLVECGVLRKERFDVKQAYYERSYGESPHDHLVCRRCGRIIEFEADEVVSMRNRIAQRHNFHGVGHRFQITGLCWECTHSCPLNRVPEA